MYTGSSCEIFSQISFSGYLEDVSRLNENYTTSQILEGHN